MCLALVAGLVSGTGEFLALGSAASAATPSAALGAALDNARRALGAPGAQGAVMSCGNVVWSGASGEKSTSGSQLVTTTTPFVLSSTTKTVTAAMVMQLVQLRRFALTTPLARFYPNLPNAQQVTIRMLLSNSSGLPEYSDNEQIASFIENPRHQWTRQQITSELSGMEAQFAPGAQFGYTNSNWVVLGGIIEQVTGMPLNTYFEKEVAKPAGMTHSTFTYDPARSPEFAHPYTKAEDGSLTDDFVPGVGIASNYWGPVFTDGGLASTALDLARFANALFSDRLVGRSTLNEMMQLGLGDYGLGMATNLEGGHTWYGHSGSYGGFESEDWTDPTRHVTIAVTTNLEGADDDSESATAQGTAETLWSALAQAYEQSPGSHAACGSPKG